MKSANVLVALASVLAPIALAQSIAELKAGFVDPPAEARPMMRWWWFGPAVTKPELARELKAMKDGGIGGVEVQPVYPLEVDQPAKGFRNLPYLSDEFLGMLKFTSEQARSLGLRMDLTLGSGWPYGGPQIPIELSSSRLRVERVKVSAGTQIVPVPALSAGERLIAAFDGESKKELPGAAGGQLKLAEGAGRPREVWFFIASRTRQTVKRAAAGAEGYVLDHYDPKAVDRYLSAVGDRLMSAFGSNDKPFAIFCDSLEVYGADWTGDLLEQFQKRRGYDLRPWLPALVADMGAKTAAVRYDWGRTLTEVFEDRFLGRMRQWTQANGVKFRIQGYGIPPAVLSDYRYADLPEGEGAQWTIVRASRWASSASHLLRRPVTSTETWTWLHSPVFRATPLDIKAEADIHFIEGITQLIGHGWPYTAEGVEYPGWRFYASAVFDEKNPWWIVMPDLMRYLQRISYLLRQGEPANDVALYLPESDAWSQFSAGKVHMIEVLRDLVGTELIPRILSAGYGFDFFDDGTLDAMLASKRYRVVVLPAVRAMPPDTARKLAEFAAGGGVILATKHKPERAPGLMAREDDHAAVRALAVRLVTNEAGLEEALHGALRPDVAMSPRNEGLAFIHRKRRQGDIYFVVNTTNTSVATTATFRVQGLEAQFWNALNGEVTAAPVAQSTDRGTSIRLELAPYESRTIVFSAAKSATPAKTHSRSTRGIDLDTNWTVRFGKEGQPIAYERLRSWTADQSTRHFSGVATYEHDLEVPATWVGSAVTLDFGEGTPVQQPSSADTRPSNPGVRAWLEGPVREAAVVYINDQRAGSVWCPPYRVQVGPLLRPERNRVRIEVANLALNYMAGHPLPNYRELRARYGNRFDPQDMDKVQPVEAGLLGPIRLIGPTP